MTRPHSVSGDESGSESESSLHPQSSAKRGSGGAGNSQNPNLDPDRPIRKRRRLILCCLPCKRRKSRCDKHLPCSTCTARGEAAGCEYMEGAKPVRTAILRPEEDELGQASVDQQERERERSEMRAMKDRLASLEGLLARVVGQGGNAQEAVDLGLAEPGDSHLSGIANRSVDGAATDAHATGTSPILGRDSQDGADDWWQALNDHHAPQRPNKPDDIWQRYAREKASSVWQSQYTGQGTWYAPETHRATLSNVDANSAALAPGSQVLPARRQPSDLISRGTPSYSALQPPISSPTGQTGFISYAKDQYEPITGASIHLDSDEAANRRWPGVASADGNRLYRIHKLWVASLQTVLDGIPSRSITQLLVNCFFDDVQGFSFFLHPWIFNEELQHFFHLRSSGKQLEVDPGWLGVLIGVIWYASHHIIDAGRFPAGANEMGIDTTWLLQNCKICFENYSTVLNCSYWMYKPQLRVLTSILIMLPLQAICRFRGWMGGPASSTPEQRDPWLDVAVGLVKSLGLHLSPDTSAGGAAAYTWPSNKMCTEDLALPPPSNNYSRTPYGRELCRLLFHSTMRLDTLSVELAAQTRPIENRLPFAFPEGTYTTPFPSNYTQSACFSPTSSPLPLHVLTPHTWAIHSCMISRHARRLREMSRKPFPGLPSAAGRRPFDDAHADYLAGDVFMSHREPMDAHIEDVLIMYKDMKRDYDDFLELRDGGQLRSVKDELRWLCLNSHYAFYMLQLQMPFYIRSFHEGKHIHLRESAIELARRALHGNRRLILDHLNSPLVRITTALYTHTLVALRVLFVQGLMEPSLRSDAKAEVEYTVPLFAPRRTRADAMDPSPSNEDGSGSAGLSGLWSDGEGWYLSRPDKLAGLETVMGMRAELAGETKPSTPEEVDEVLSRLRQKGADAAAAEMVRAALPGSTAASSTFSPSFAASGVIVPSVAGQTPGLAKKKYKTSDQSPWFPMGPSVPDHVPASVHVMDAQQDPRTQQNQQRVSPAGTIGSGRLTTPASTGLATPIWVDPNDEKNRQPNIGSWFKANDQSTPVTVPKTQDKPPGSDIVADLPDPMLGSSSGSMNDMTAPSQAHAQPEIPLQSLGTSYQALPPHSHSGIPSPACSPVAGSGHINSTSAVPTPMDLPGNMGGPSSAWFDEIFEQGPGATPADTTAAVAGPGTDTGTGAGAGELDVLGQVGDQAFDLSQSYPQSQSQSDGVSPTAQMMPPPFELGSVGPSPLVPTPHRFEATPQPLAGRIRAWF